MGGLKDVSAEQQAPQETSEQTPERTVRRFRRIPPVAIAAGALVLAIAVVGVTVVRSLPADEPTKRTAAPRTWRLEPGESVVVVPAGLVRIVDGDSGIYRMGDGSLEQVRMIGIDAPEAISFTDNYTVGALTAARRFCGKDKQVFLEIGVNERDRYGQLLAYVWQEKPSARPSASDVRSKMLNSKMVVEGYAREFYRIPGVTYANDRYTPLLSGYASQAQAQKKGLWDPAFVKAAGYSAAWAVRDSSEFRPITTPFVGNRTTRKLHRASCPNAQSMRLGERVHFDKRGAAIVSGFVPCNLCRP